MVYCKEGVIIFGDFITDEIVCVADTFCSESCEGFVKCRENINSIRDFVLLAFRFNGGVLASNGVKYDVACGLFGDSQFGFFICDVFQESICNIVCSFNVV